MSFIAATLAPFRDDGSEHFERRATPIGYGDTAESIGVTECERQCFRPATKPLDWTGSGGENYTLKLDGSEDGITQGHWLTDGELQFLGSVPAGEGRGGVCGVV